MYFQFGSTSVFGNKMLELLFNKPIKSLATKMDGVIHFNIMSGCVRKPTATHLRTIVIALKLFRFIIHPIIFPDEKSDPNSKKKKNQLEKSDPGDSK